MSRRKTICLVIASGDTPHSQRISQGVFAQCEKYGYNVAQFVSMMSLDYFVGYKDIAQGEIQIFNLIDFSRFDGVILDSISLMPSGSPEYIEKLYQKLLKLPGLPVCCIGFPYKDLPVIENANDEQMRTLCRHAVTVHNCRDICLLTGPKDNHEAELRLSVMLDELKKLGVSVSDEHIVYGDFWYTSGTRLAEDICSGRITKPDAIIAASDHMALGFIDEYTKRGGRVPEDVCVLGFEANPEALLAKIPLSTIESNFAKCAADAVDRIRTALEPELPLLPYEPDLLAMFHTARSCGCPQDLSRTMDVIKHSLYLRASHYNEDIYNNIDLGLLMESYTSERLSASRSPWECIGNIHGSLYLIRPLVNFFLCLREDWLAPDEERAPDFPKRMQLVLACSMIGEADHCTKETAYSFDTSLMLPQMFEEHDKPYVYYFSPIHFSDKNFGYAVLQREFSDFRRFNLVYRIWLRFVNTALEMVRSKEHFIMLSIHDKMTGLLNRRGMYERLSRLYAKTYPGQTLFACVIDMDGLKYINDTFGHAEGDYGIKRVSEAVLSITEGGDICARVGGDEFYLVGWRKSFDRAAITARFCTALQALTEPDEKPYLVSASIGFSVCGDEPDPDIEKLLSEADKDMYHYKMERKKQRK